MKNEEEEEKNLSEILRQTEAAFSGELSWVWKFGF
jgi:hypothetical protein